MSWMYCGGKLGVGRVILNKISIMVGGMGLLAVLGGVGYVLTQDLSRHVPGLGQMLSEQSGQSVRVEGPVRIGLSRHAGFWVTVEDIHVKPFAAQAYSARIERVRASIDVWALRRHEIAIDVMEIEGGAFQAESSISLKEAFSDLPEAGQTEGAGWNLTALRKLVVNRSVVGLTDDGAEFFSFPISNASAEPGKIGLSLRVDGTIEGRGVSFVGNSGPWSALISGYPVYLNGTITSMSASLVLEGTIGDLLTHGLDFQATGSAENLNDVAVLVGYGDLKRTSSATLSAHVTGTATTLSIKDLQLTYGRGDLSGWAQVTRGEALTIDGELSSKFLDLAAFEGGHLLHPPKKVFSNNALPVKLIENLEGQINFKAETILLANARLVDGRISMVAGDGIVAINPIAVAYDEGVFEASVVLDVRNVPEFKASVSMADFDLGKLLADAKMTDQIEARVNFGGRIRGSGDTFAQMFASASGQTNLLMGPSVLSSDVLGFLGGEDLAVAHTAASDQSTELKCFVSRFDIVDGIAKSRAFLLETHDSVTTGRGSMNLETESIDLRMVPRPKNPADLGSAADLRITGSFMDPKVRIEKKRLSRGIAGSLGRFALARQGGEVLLPLIEQPAQNNNACIVSLTGHKVGA